jgi:hypothetical protein
MFFRKHSSLSCQNINKKILTAVFALDSRFQHEMETLDYAVNDFSTNALAYYAKVSITTFCEFGAGLLKGSSMKWKH